MKKKILLLTLIALLVVPTIAFADSFRFEVGVNQENGTKVYKENDEVKIDIKISEINVGENGMNTVEGVLEYDEDLFENVTSSNFSGKNGWSFTYNDTTSGQKGKFVGMVLSSGIKEEQEIGTITLKVRNSVKKAATSTEVTIKNVATNNGKILVFDQDKKMNVPLEVEYKENNPFIIVVIIVAIVAIALGLFAIVGKKRK